MGDNDVDQIHNHESSVVGAEEEERTVVGTLQKVL